jgi:hypothetical protein
LKGQKALHNRGRKQTNKLGQEFRQKLPAKLPAEALSKMVVTCTGSDLGSSGHSNLSTFKILRPAFTSGVPV